MAQLELGQFVAAQKSLRRALEISGKADIEAFGIAEFNERCKQSVFRYKAEWEALSERIGYWLDYNRPYVTYTNDYVESVWWLLKNLAGRDLLYEGQKVLPYCIRCGTTLSSHELALGYATHKSPSIYSLFRLVCDDDETRYLLVWTTTPWTLPSNLAIAVDSGHWQAWYNKVVVYQFDLHQHDDAADAGNGSVDNQT